VPKIDCPAEPAPLHDGDILIVASDGLQFLSNTQIEAALRRNRHLSSAEIVDTLLHQVTALEDPDLDNVSFSVIKMKDAGAERTPETRAEPEALIRRVG
jgi:serine/threonine protein phosphatase PrpC